MFATTRHCSLPSEPDKSSSHPHIPLKINFHFTLLSKSSFFHSNFSIKIPYISHLSLLSTHPTNLTPLDFFTLIRFFQGVQIVHSLNNSTAPIPWFLLLRTNCHSQHPVLKHPQSIFFPQNIRDKVSHPYEICQVASRL